jgi:hypothetical protein
MPGDRPVDAECRRRLAMHQHQISAINIPVAQHLLQTPMRGVGSCDNH